MPEYRAATENDYDDICSLIKSKEELYLVYPGGTFPLTSTQLKALSRVRMELTVVVQQEKIIGFANLYNYKQNQSAFIGNVIIDKSHRGKGYGKGVVSYMLKQAHVKHKLREVRISVFSENTPAVLLYSDLGFMPYEIEQRENPEGRKVALIHMKKILGRNET